VKTMKRCRTLFLGWDRPLLWTAVEYLRTEHGPASGQPQRWQLDPFLIVLPTRRAGRRLRELLERTAASDGLGLRAPQIITAGELPEFLYGRPAETKLADELERTLAWTSSLQQTEPSALAFLFPVLPQREAWSAWIELATTIRKLHEDLASNNLTFADVAAELANDATMAGEKARWELLETLHAHYIDSLATAGRTDPFLSRRDAIDEKRCGCDRHVLLIGTSDMSALVIEMLRQISQSAGSNGQQDFREFAITALIAADDHFRDHFDPFGTIIPSRWCQWKLPLDDSQLVPAGDVTDQATALSQWVRTIRTENLQTQPGDVAITVGVTNESMVPPIEFEMSQIGQQTYRELGWSFSQTPIGRLIELLSTHLSQLTWQSLAALLRHADVYDFVEHKLQACNDETESNRETTNKSMADGRWLISLDNLLAEHYPTRLAIPLTDKMIAIHNAAVAVADLILDSLKGFSHQDDSQSGRDHRMPLSHWAGELKAWLEKIYPPETVEPEEPLPPAADDSAIGPSQRRAKIAIRGCWKSLDRLMSLDATLDVNVSVGVGIDLVAGRLLDQRVGDLQTPGVIQIAGWLDLALEDSPSLAVVGLNHPYVPESITADPFLPGGLRTRLQMSDNERRLGRDIYALQLILSTRSFVRLIVGRTGVDGSPTPPSRLLAAAESIDVARRLVRLLSDDSIQQRNEESPPVQRSWDAKTQKTRLPIPTIGKGFDPDRDIKAMSVTSFAAYLTCPYRFYLRHVLKLSPIDDASRELAANQFGDLIHNSLEIFGNSAAKDAKNLKEIEDAMLAALDEFSFAYLGLSPAPAVKLQIEQARQRLRHVAARQAQWRSEGWHIWKVEASVGEKDNAGIDVDNQRMLIRGRFDRIDRHDDGRWAILDYKTHGHHPRKKHIEKTADGFRWIELQLPIYRLMIPYLVGHDVNPKDVTLGYFNVSEKESETKINEADFTETEYAAADDLINQCVRSIRAGRFEPTNEPVMYDDYAMIMQSEIAEQLFDSDEGGGEDGYGEESLAAGMFVARSFGGDE